MNQHQESMTLQESVCLTKESQRKAFLHPVRTKILGLLVENAHTISQIASELKVHPANITHHFRILVKEGLIRLTEKRDIGRVVEIYYRATARRFDILPPDGEITGANAKVLRFLRDDLNSTIRALKGDDSEALMGLIETAKIDRKKFVVFCDKLRTLIKEFENPESESGEMFALNVSIYPHKADYWPLGKYEIRKKKSGPRLVRRKDEN